jgi:hypothetical protein
MSNRKEGSPPPKFATKLPAGCRVDEETGKILVPLSMRYDPQVLKLIRAGCRWAIMWEESEKR